MKIFLALILLSTSAWAEIFEVHSVARHRVREKSWIVKFADGRVGFWKEDEDPQLDPGSLGRTLIDAQLDPNHELTGIRIIDHLQELQTTKPEKSLTLPGYVPTVYPTYRFATDVLTGMRRQWTRDSQCYDRSHIWAYEEAVYGQRYLQKAFLFFSDDYIARYNYPWWFHTAPYAKVRLNGEVVDRVMDPGFAQYPLKFKLWTDLFMKNKAQCKVVEKYSGYSQHGGEDDCYLILTTMYFWQPKDLEAYENSGVLKTRYIDWEIRHAYQYGFNIYLP